MSSITVQASESWADPVAVSTFIAAFVALVGLLVTIWMARADRTEAQAQLRDEREQRARDLLRQERVPQLMEIARLYARQVAASGSEQADTYGSAELEALLWLLPEGMGRKLKRQFSVPLSKKDEQELAKEIGTSTIPTRFSKEELFKELGSNINWARAGGNPADRT